MEKLSATQINRILSYAGFVLVSYELIKGMIVRPVQVFYNNTTFGEKMPFKSYEIDVLSRSRNEFEACLLYLKDLMEAIDDRDFATHCHLCHGPWITPSRGGDLTPCCPPRSQCLIGYRSQRRHVTVPERTRDLFSSVALSGHGLLCPADCR